MKPLALGLTKQGLPQRVTSSTYLFVSAARRKMLSIGGKCRCGNSLIMSQQCVDWSTLHQVQYLGAAIIAAGDHEISMRMEGDGVHEARMTAIQLKQFMCSLIKNLNPLVGQCDGYQRSTGMPSNVHTEAICLLEVAIHNFAGGCVKDLGGMVV